MARYCFTILGSIIFFSLHIDVGSAYPTPVDFSGNLLRWEIGETNRKVTWNVVADQSSSLPLFEQITAVAAEKWSSVPTSAFRLERVSSQLDAQITVEFRDQIIGGDAAAGYAEFDETTESGPVHCTIHIAAAPGEDWSNIPKTTLHELGHCIGLGHSLVPESIMSYALESNSFNLSLDDEAAVARLYPLNQEDPALPMGCAVGSQNKATANSLIIFLCFLPVVAGFFWGRIRFALARHPPGQYLRPIGVKLALGLLPKPPKSFNQDSRLMKRKR